VLDLIQELSLVGREEFFEGIHPLRCVILEWKLCPVLFKVLGKVLLREEFDLVYGRTVVGIELDAVRSGMRIVQHTLVDVDSHVHAERVPAPVLIVDENQFLVVVVVNENVVFLAVVV